MPAFTAEAFRGNPAAICVLREEADPNWMQSVALEMNLSETAYLVPRADGFGLSSRSVSRPLVPFRFGKSVSSRASDTILHTTNTCRCLDGNFGNRFT